MFLPNFPFKLVPTSTSMDTYLHKLVTEMMSMCAKTKPNLKPNQASKISRSLQNRKVL